MTFMVHDKNGNVWPPMFKSELCDPNSPHSILSHKAKSAAAAPVETAGAVGVAVSLTAGSAGTVCLHFPVTIARLQELEELQRRASVADAEGNNRR